MKNTAPENCRSRAKGIGDARDALYKGPSHEEDVRMPIFSIFAVYFIIWWLTLFAILPIGLRTQAEDNAVVPGTVESAPSHFRLGRVLLLTTLVSAAIYGAWYVCSVYLGLGIDAIPRIVPKFE